MPVDPKISDEDAELVAELVNTLLTELCTSYKSGIIFMDKTYGLSGKYVFFLLL